jgi:SSS family solute:Na+ symporter
MIFANLFYWGTNQYVIQRTLGSASLAEGQKGVLYSGYFKLLVPFFMMVPGVIAFHLYGGQLQSIDLAYPQLVKNVLPVYMSGFFLAVLLGAVFSSFNSLLNSAATLFVLDVYQPYKNTSLSDQQLIKVAKIASVVIALFSFVVSPLLQFAPEGLFQIIRIFTGFYNIPVITVVLVGLFTKHVPGFAAKVVICFHVVAYAILKFVIDVDINFIHIYGLLFVIEMTIMLVIGYWMPLEKPWKLTNNSKVDMTPWTYGLPLSITMVSCVIIIYLLFSPIGLVNGLSPAFWPAVSSVVVINGLLCWLSLKYWHKKYRRKLDNTIAH